MFVRGAATVALLAGAPAAWARNVVAASRSSLARSRFVPVLGSTFRMTGDGHDVDVVLAQITDLSPVLRAADQDRFALLFDVSVGQPLASGIRTFHNDDVGEVSLFVSPVDRGIKAGHYEAIINRSTS
jgi:hypothetical protein